MSAVATLIEELDGIAVETQRQKVRRRSRDFYWYSPILERKLDRVTADAVVTPENEAEVLKVVAACHRHRVPLTVRGGGTGNYGQAMPSNGGVVLDVSELNRIKEIGLGRARVEAGAKLAEIDAQCQSQGRPWLMQASTITGRCGPCCSTAPAGSSATRRSGSTWAKSALRISCQ